VRASFLAGHKRSLIRVVLLGFAGALLLFVLAAGVWGVPEEDAAILYSYSRNLAESGAITYIPAGPRAEGSTDFGWMVSIAVLQKLGIGNHSATALLNSASLLLVGLRLATIAGPGRTALGRPRVLLAWAAFLAVVLGSGLAVSGLGGFSTIAQMALLAVLFSSCLFARFDALFLGSSLVFILLRPDSVAYYVACVGPFVLVRAWRARNGGDGVRGAARTAALPLLVFALYWLLRGLYFQRAFPLPFYVKQVQSGGLGAFAERLSQELLFTATTQLALAIMLLVALLLCATQAQGGPPAEWKAGLLGCGVFFGVQSLYLSRFHLIQNVGDRFHAPLLGIAAAWLACFLLVRADRLPWGGRRSVASLGLLAALLLGSVEAIVGLQRVVDGYRNVLRVRQTSTTVPLSLALAELHRRRRVGLMFVTEAGRLSYYSRIPSIDTWGLNTPEFARAPLQDPQQVARKRPALINMHVDFARLSLEPLSASALRVGRDCRRSGDPASDGYCGWHQMNQAIFQGARQLGYSMVVVPYRRNAPPDARHDLFLVDPSSPVARELEAVLRAHGGTPIREPAALKNYRW
jgi:hypothetical protein